MTPIEIANLINCAAKLLRVQPQDVMNTTYKARHPAMIARKLVYYRMRENGEELERIGRAFGKQSSAPRSAIRWMDTAGREFLPLLDKLPMMAKG